VKGVYSLLFGVNEEVNFEEKIFNIAVVLGIAVLTIGIVINLLFDADIYLDLLFLAIWIIIYHLSRRKNSFNWLSSFTLSVVVFGVYPYNWIASSGVLDSTPYYSLLFISIICIVKKGKARRNLLLSIFAVQYILIAYDYIRMDSVANETFIFVIVHLSILSIVTATLLTLYSKTYFQERRRSTIYAKTIEKQNKEQMQYMINLEELNNRLKSERHEFNNHLGIIYGLMNNKEYDKTTDYTSKLVESVSEYRNIINIPYPAVCALINYKLANVKKEKIELKVNANIPNGLKINEYDIGIILGNLIGNAIEALGKVEEAERYIFLELKYKPDYIIIRVENPYNESLIYENKEYVSTKNDGDIEEHGYGLNNVKDIVEKHNGLININHDNNIFDINIALLCMK
jgi:signal transduction histidine kinase